MINITFSFALFAQSSWLAAQQILRQNSFSRNFFFRMNAKFVNFQMLISFKIKCCLIFIKKFHSKWWLKFLLQNRKSGLDLYGSKTIFFLTSANFPQKEISKWLPKTSKLFRRKLFVHLGNESRQTWHRIDGLFSHKLGTQTMATSATKQWLFLAANWLWLEDRQDSYNIT